MRHGMLFFMARAIVLAEGDLGGATAKTANGLVVHCQADEIVAVIDSTHAGQDAGTVVAKRALGIPVVATLEEALAHDPERLYLGVANVGGVMPDVFRDVIRGALEAGLHVINGLHAFLDEDPEFGPMLEAGHGSVWDVRRPPKDLKVLDGSIYDCRVPRVVIMGMDCDAGKRLTTIQFLHAAQERGINAGFVATGQTGCMLGPDAGAVIDRIPADFAAGQVERMVLASAAKGRDMILVPGQASIQHAAFSGVSLAILHGSAPQAAILQVVPGRQQRILFDHPGLRVGDIRDEIEAIERLGRTRVVALAVNGQHIDDVQAACAELTAEFGIPAIDPLFGDPSHLVDAVVDALATAGHADFVPLVKVTQTPASTSRTA